MGVDDVVIPVVGECDDSWLNDARVVQVEADDVSRALADAAASAAEVVQGAVGAGTGMVCFDWKGGIGSSSRVTEDGHARRRARAGELRRQRRAARGRRAGRAATWRPAEPARGPAGSCIAVVATDAPLGSAQLNRIARRAGLGLGRTGSVAHHGSGEIFVAFSTTDARRARRRRGRPRSPTASSTRSSRPPSRRPRRPC